MLIGGIHPKTFRIEFKRHFISLKRMVRLTNHGVVNDSTFFPLGTVYLEEKARPSQELSTSSNVSVRAEVQDRALLGTRKLWPLQLFDSFETFPSDMAVDAPRSFKKTIDDDEDIKSHTCHGSGEASI